MITLFLFKTVRKLYYLSGFLMGMVSAFVITSPFAALVHILKGLAQ